MNTSTSRLRPFTSYSGSVKEKIHELPLSGLNAIVGDEATYKSTIGIGMRLALTGKYDPVGHNPSDLITLAADALVGIEAKLSGPDGLAEWRLKVDPETGKPKKSVPPHFEGPIGALTDDERYCVIPTDSVRDLLKNARGDKTKREAFIRRFGGAIKDITCPFTDDEEDAKEKKAWDAAIETCKRKLEADASADSLLASLSKHFRDESGAKRREITPIEKFVADKRRQISQAEMAGGIAPELLPELEEEFQQAQAWASSNGDRQAKIELEKDLFSLKNDLDAAGAALFTAAHACATQEEANRLEVQASQASIDEAYAKSLKATRGAAAYSTLAELYAESERIDARKCRFCPNTFDSIDPIVATKKLFEMKAGIRADDVRVAEQEYETAQFEFTTLLARNRDAIEALRTTERLAENASILLKRDLQAKEKELKEVSARLAKAPAKAPSRTVEAIETQLKAYKDATEARVACEREGLRLRKLEKEYNLFKKLEGEAEALQKSIMARVAKKASEEVSLGMLDGRRARLDPVTCDWYVVRKDGKEFGPFGALCGTEKTALLLGLVAAWTRGSPLRIAIFDDEDMVGLSTKGIKDFYAQCEALFDRDDFTQVVVINNRPELVPAKRWNTIIREPRAKTPDEASVAS